MARESRQRREVRERREARETRASLAFYVALILLVGQFIALLLGAPVNYLLLAITGATWLGILFGPTTMIEFFRAIRGSETKPQRGGGDGDA